jgi:hypothetical protein
MADGGDFGPVSIPWFNGGLFKAGEPVLDLTADDIDRLVALNAYDWASVEPSIFGTLFERTLDPAKRSQIGAHYTSREDILTLLEPVLMAPLRREWADIQRQAEELWPQLADKKKAAKARKELDKILRDFVERIAAVKILDPACGSGNFLYVAITLLLDLEKEVITKAASYGTSLLPQVRPSQLYGLEINPYAAELAQVVIWIGYLQWMHFNGFNAKRDPILEPIQTIRNMDAIINLSDPDNPKEPEWPEADVIVGNPPFLGNKRLRTELGDEYVKPLFSLYRDRVPNFSDLCGYWLARAREAVTSGHASRVGLLATTGIKQVGSRPVLSAIIDTAHVFFVETDRDWVLDGASTRITMIGFASKECRDPLRVDGKSAAHLNSDLSTGIDVTASRPLLSNRGSCFMGATKVGAFDIDDDIARDFLFASNPNARPTSDVVRPYMNGSDVVRRNSMRWIVDYGPEASEQFASGFAGVFEHLKKHVRPQRASHRVPKLRDNWWLFERPRPDLREKMVVLERFIATPVVSKHRIFAFLDAVTLPDAKIIAITTDQLSNFGVLHSRVHEQWSLSLCGWHGVGNDITYNPSTCFMTFPFPEPTAAQRDAIAAAAKELDTLRSNWLNPPEWTREEVLTFPGSVDGPWARYVAEANAKGIGTVRYPRTVPADDAAAKKLAKRTLTNLYNERPTWLALAHKRVDEAVFAAYGWPGDLTDDDLLARLLALNLDRAGSAAAAGPGGAAPARAQRPAPRRRKT